MIEQNEFYQSHLDRVSRSFAFCIAQLPDPLRAWVGLSYLLCRVLDTVEDSPWPDKARQMEVFALFDGALSDPKQTPAIAEWASRFSAQVPASERMLLQDAEVLFQDLHDLPAPVRHQITEMVLSMSMGMQHFARQNPPGQLRLQTLTEVNQYCFFVAGLVGELLTQLLAKVETTFSATPTEVLRSHHFGLFLQKVNLLKDQTADESVGRHLIPERQIVEQSAALNATEAFAFLAALPKVQIEFRRFCAWSLFLGLEAVSTARASIEAQKVLKVPREKAAEIIAQVEEALHDDGLLNVMFERAMDLLAWPRIPKDPAAQPAPIAAVPEWFLRFYRGQLPPQSLSELGITS